MDGWRALANGAAQGGHGEMKPRTGVRHFVAQLEVTRQAMRSMRMNRIGTIVASLLALLVLAACVGGEGSQPGRELGSR